MADLTFEKYAIPSAPLGEDSALPDIHVNSYIRANIELSDKISEDDGKYIGKGMISTLLPYKITDGYTRDRAVREFNAAVLENQYLRAVFLPELGGRLWSLYDKSSGRELLYKNDVFQPANLALRNAWFSGGVEWNVGIKGHNPLTCSPLFAQKAETEDGNQILRMYELERIRGVVYVIEATLCKNALVMNITIENTADRDTPMYWWSNIAVPETPKTRVITPASEAFYCGYTDGKYYLDKSGIPFIDGKDITYASNSTRSRDFFFNIPDESDKWIAAVDGDGKGLLHLSDPILKGRKLFVWGQHEGGRHWNEWLSDKAGSYVEIQAGLLKTQLEHFVMPKRSVINWRECYCPVQVDPALIHGELTDAQSALHGEVKGKLSYLDPKLFSAVKTYPLSQYGSGWGALEEKLRGERISSVCQFPQCSIGDEQADWLALLDGKPLPDRDTALTVPSYVAGKAWTALMEGTPAENWFYYYHLGVLRYCDGDIDGAEKCFIKSNALSENAWALRNLAQIQKNIQGKTDEAADNILRAVRILPDYIPLAVECFSALIKAKRYGELIELYPTLPDKVRGYGRIRMLLGDCYSRLGKTDEAMSIITPELTVPDVMEGEYALSNIWIGIYAQVLAKELGVSPDSLSDSEVLEHYPLPRELDFRMH